MIAIANALLAEDAQGDEIVESLLAESRKFQEKKRLAGRKGGKARANNYRRTNGAADTREDSDETARATEEATTDSKNYGYDQANQGVADAATRKGADEHDTARDTASCNPESGTSATSKALRGSPKPRGGATGKRRHALPPTKTLVYEFAQNSGLDEDDARNWFEMNYVEREGCDKDGVVIENWKGHLTAYCKTMTKKRSA